MYWMRSKKIGMRLPVLVLLIGVFNGGMLCAAENSVSGDAVFAPGDCRSGGTHRAPPGLPEFEPLTMAGHFSCEIPNGWVKEADPCGLAGGETGGCGIVLHGPRSGAISPRISLRDYAGENPRFSSPEEFVGAHSRPVFVLREGDYYGPVEETSVADRPAWTFERHKNVFVPMPDPPEPDTEDVRIYEGMERMARPVAVVERFVVVPAQEGFYVLHFSATTDAACRVSEIFDRIVASFRAFR